MVVVNTDPHDALISVYVIVTVPWLTPYTIPVVAPTVPIAVLLLLHTPDPPDAVASLNGIVKVVHTLPGPVIAPANGDTFTVTTVVVVADPQNALVSVYVIVVVPTLIPVTIPEVEPILPLVGILLLHVPVPPDAVASLNWIVDPWHTNPALPIVPAIGDGLTVTTVVV